MKILIIENIINIHIHILLLGVQSSNRGVDKGNQIDGWQPFIVGKNKNIKINHNFFFINFLNYKNTLYIIS